MSHLPFRRLTTLRARQCNGQADRHPAPRLRGAFMIDARRFARARPSRALLKIGPALVPGLPHASVAEGSPRGARALANIPCARCGWARSRLPGASGATARRAHTALLRALQLICPPANRRAGGNKCSRIGRYREGAGAPDGVAAQNKSSGHAVRVGERRHELSDVLARRPQVLRPTASASPMPYGSPR